MTYHLESKPKRLFADDWLLYRNIKTDQDAASLQDDLNNLQGIVH